MITKARFLAAEDEPTSAVALRSVLKHLGYHTDLARNGREAVEMWERGCYDMILMDVQMPTMDGLAATRLIREKERVTGGHIPIVALTASSLPEEKEECITAGMDACLGKPMDLTKDDILLKRLLGHP